MFGDNPIRKQDLTDGSKLFVTSVFSTIQGEGPLAGFPAVFIRMAGCNLACTFCDTEFEAGMEVPLTIGAIIDSIEEVHPSHIPPLIVITGGEPLRQEITPLIDQLLSMGCQHVQLETAGTLWLDSLDKYFQEFELDGRVSIVCSPKTGKVHPRVEANCSDWKYIVRAGDMSVLDGLPATSTQVYDKESQIFRPSGKGWMPNTFWLQPCDEQESDLTLLNQQEAIRICMAFNYRLCLQLHKIVGLE